MGILVSILKAQPPTLAYTRAHAREIAPRIFEPELCSRLIAHQETGGEFSGVMRDAGDRTVVVMDELKKRRDMLVEDADLQAALRQRLERRLFPLIERGAVVFCCSLQHEAVAVTQGRRYAFLPLLYDEAGAQIREANLQYLAPDRE